MADIRFPKPEVDQPAADQDTSLKFGTHIDFDLKRVLSLTKPATGSRFATPWPPS